MEYHRLTLEERYQIAALTTSGLSKSQIARQLRRHRSTIGRELKRGGRDYEVCRAEARTQRLRHAPHLRTRKIRGKVKRCIERKIKGDWSPEQIEGWLRKSGGDPSVSHPTIYRYLERDKINGGRLWKRLRILRRQRKDRKSPKWHPTHFMPDRVFIESRPKIVEKRSRVGDYERDTVLGKRGGPVLLTIVDRTSRLLKLAWLPKSTAQSIHEATVKALKSEPVRTITNDNGFEFARHAETGKALKAQIYFSTAYRSWERGTSENTNGLLRQYFPKKTPIPRLTRRDIARIERLLNTRPRKCLGYRTPMEVHNELKSLDVALTA